MPVVPEALEKFDERVHLRGGAPRRSHHKRRVAAVAPQSRQFREDRDAVVGPARLQGVERHPAARLVPGAFVVAKFDLDGYFGLLGKVFEDVALDAAQDERGDETLQRRRGASVRREPPREVPGRSEQSGVEEVADAPELRKPVLDGRAGGDDAELRPEPLRRLGALR